MEFNQNAGVIYLIPTVIAPATINNVITPQIVEIISSVDYYLVENIRTARRYISELKNGYDNLDLPKPISELTFVELSKQTSQEQVSGYLEKIIEGRNAGIISEAGCPGIADPGALAVDHAHKMGIRVVPLVGPSSILLALMASGFSGQSFAFHGYLPIPSDEKIKSLKYLEAESHKRKQTQIFMETPYRNEKLLKDILVNLNPSTRLCIAKDITGPDEVIITKTVKEWKSIDISLHKIPAIFMIYVY